MRAATSLMLFSFLRKKPGEGRGDPSPEPRRVGFGMSLNDDVHGAHLDGDAIVLSGSLGGGRYPSRPAGDWMSEESGYRMVLQPMDLRGRMAGPPAVTVNSIARPVVLSVLSSRGLSGMLSVYAPDRDSAAALMREATGTEGVEYGFSVGLMEANLANLRVRKSPSEDDGLPGPMCLFGDYLGDGSELDLPGNEARKSDFAWGFHIAGRDVVLSSDLGSSVHSESGFGEVGDGEIRIALDRHPLEGTGHTVSTASGPIGRDVAVAICSDRVRQGVLCVYTPRREDALEIMTEALGGRRPEEVILDGIGFFCRKGEKEGPKAFFGRPPE